MSGPKRMSANEARLLASNAVARKKAELVELGLDDAFESIVEAVDAGDTSCDAFLADLWNHADGWGVDSGVYAEAVESSVDEVAKRLRKEGYEVDVLRPENEFEKLVIDWSDSPKAAPIAEEAGT